MDSNVSAKSSTAKADRQAKLQTLFATLLEECCGGNMAEMGRRIDKDASYVKRLLLPDDQSGRKRVGPEIMRACNEAFSLPVGFWEGNATSTFGNDSLEHVFKRLGDEVAKVSEVNREAVAVLLGNLARRPELHQEICKSVKALLACSS